MYVFFRPRKSYNSHKHTGLVTPDLSVGGSNIEFIEKWPKLGHVISLNLSDDHHHHHHHHIRLLMDDKRSHTIQ